MVTPIILTIILLAYAVLNVPLSNQCASPFIAVVLICIVWKLWDAELSKALGIKNEKKSDISDLHAVISEQQKEIGELKEMVAKLLPDEKKEEKSDKK